MLEQLRKVKSKVETLAQDKNLDQAKGAFKKLLKEAQKDFISLINKDLEAAKKKITSEKAQMLKEFEKQKNLASKFFNDQKKEVSHLQAKIEKLLATKENIIKKKKASPAAAESKPAPSRTSKKVTTKKQPSSTGQTPSSTTKKRTTKKANA